MTLICISTDILTNPFLNFSSLTFIFSLKWLSAVEINAYYGHGKNQSIVVQFTREGKVLNLLLKSYPTGDMQMTICKLFLQSWTKNWYFSLKDPVGLIEVISSTILAFYSIGKRLGISPLFKMLQTYSTILYLRIWVSENKNIVCLCYNPAIFITFWTSYTQFLELTSLYSVMYAMYELSCARDLRPLPPTPTSKACPNVVVITRTILITCSIATINKTRFIRFAEYMLLYYSRYW